MKSFLKKALWGLALLPFLFLCVLWGIESISYAEIKPEEGMRYFVWEKRFGKPEGKILRFKKENKTYYQVIGQHRSKWAIYAGPPAYIFDAQGNLTDWCPDLGEGSDYYRRWPVMRLGAQDLPYGAFIRLLSLEK